MNSVNTFFETIGEYANLISFASAFVSFCVFCISTMSVFKTKNSIKALKFNIDSAENQLHIKIKDINTKQYDKIINYIEEKDKLEIINIRSKSDTEYSIFVDAFVKLNQPEKDEIVKILRGERIFHKREIVENFFVDRKIQLRDIIKH
jgi:hypothetical protein